ncbi:MAG: PLP-dependent transferase [Actinomycetota bacterium]|nr:PLP-dependent transferase [Actinomycetota bacterium]
MAENPRRTPAPETLAVHAGRPERRPDAPLNVPPVLASTYHAGGEAGYGRFGNETWEALEEALGALEGGHALAFSSGMGAASAVLETLPVGAVVVASASLYSGTAALLDEHARTGRLAVRRVDTGDDDAVRSASGDAALLWLETPGNPLLQEADIPGLAALCGEHGTLLAVDNTFATPLLQRPLATGADVVVHSATKYLAGHSDVLLGATVCGDTALRDRLAFIRTTRGGIPGAFEAWLTLRGMRTLHLRVERSQANARELAARLNGHPCVTRVRYPGWGAIVSIEVAGGAAAADAVCDAVRLWVHATSLGGVESMLERRRRWPAESPLVPESLLRLSVGVEDVDDLWDDLAAALAGLG